MKRFKLLSIGRGFGSLTALILCAGTAIGQNTEKNNSTSTIPEAVFQSIKPACMPCHSDAGRDKPKSAVNFSVWDQYKPVEKKLLAASIIGEVKKGSMPPKRFVESHPDAALSESQINQIVQWCDSLKARP